MCRPTQLAPSLPGAKYLQLSFHYPSVIVSPLPFGHVVYPLWSLYFVRRQRN